MRHKILGAAGAAAAIVMLASTAGAAAPAWTVAASVDPSATTNVLNAVSARTGTDAWAVGDDKAAVDDATFAMLAEHWNGSQWSQVPTPDLPTSDEKLLAVSAGGASDVWAVGSQGPTGTATQHPLAAHWDGAAWTIVTTPATSGHAALAGVASLAPGNAWAVGTGNGKALIEHWDGTAWSLVTAPAPALPAGTTLLTDSLSAIAATSATDIWAVGSYVVTPGSFMQRRSLTMHYNGTTWQVVTSPNGATPFELRGVTAVAPNDAWAVGDALATDGSGQPGQTFVMHWNGTSWTATTSPSPASNATLSSVSAASATDVWAVGHRTQQITSSEVHGVSLIEHWDGSAWSVVPTPAIPDPDHQLQGVAATPTAAFAVGLRLTSPVYRTLILQH